MPVRVDLGRVEVLTMRELTLHTARVIDQVRQDGLPRAIVKHGRFQASLWPLKDNFEAGLLAQAIRDGTVVVATSEAGKSVDELLSEDVASGDEVTHEHDDLEEPSFGSVSMTEFNQATSQVVDRVHGGERLFVTKHGRYQALLTPLPRNLESILLANVPDFVRTLDMGSRDGIGNGLPADAAEAFFDT